MVCPDHALTEATSLQLAREVRRGLFKNLHLFAQAFIFLLQAESKQGVRALAISPLHIRSRRFRAKRQIASIVFID